MTTDVSRSCRRPNSSYLLAVSTAFFVSQAGIERKHGLRSYLTDIPGRFQASFLDTDTSFPRFREDSRVCRFVLRLTVDEDRSTTTRL